MTRELDMQSRALGTRLAVVSRLPQRLCIHPFLYYRAGLSAHLCQALLTLRLARGQLQTLAKVCFGFAVSSEVFEASANVQVQNNRVVAQDRAPCETGG